MERRNKRDNYLKNREKALKRNILKRKQFQNKHNFNIKKNDNSI